LWNRLKIPTNKIIFIFFFRLSSSIPKNSCHKLTEICSRSTLIKLEIIKKKKNHCFLIGQLGFFFDRLTTIFLKWLSCFNLTILTGEAKWEWCRGFNQSAESHEKAILCSIIGGGPINEARWSEQLVNPWSLETNLLGWLFSNPLYAESVISRACDNWTIEKCTFFDSQSTKPRKNCCFLKIKITK
jgi:hypothetical protein